MLGRAGTSPPSSSTNTSPCSKGDMVPASVLRYGSAAHALRQLSRLCSSSTSACRRTNLYGGDSVAAVFQDDANAAGRHALAKPAHHATRHQHILHALLCTYKGAAVLSTA